MLQYPLRITEDFSRVRGIKRDPAIRSLSTREEGTGFRPTGFYRWPTYLNTGTYHFQSTMENLFTVREEDVPAHKFREKNIVLELTLIQIHSHSSICQESS